MTMGLLLKEDILLLLSEYLCSRGTITIIFNSLIKQKKNHIFICEFQYFWVRVVKVINNLIIDMT